MMGLFGKKRPDMDEDLERAAPTVAVVAHPDDVLWEREQQQLDILRTEHQWAPKPPDLLAALGEDDRHPARASAADSPLEWTIEPPEQAGLYWWRPRLVKGERRHAADAALELVLPFGARMCTAVHRNGSTTYRGVNSLEREWAGPIKTPLGLDLGAWWELQ